MIEDLSPFFAGLDAQLITIHLSGGDRTITGYFDNTFLNTQIGETIMDTTQPRLTCVFSAVAGVPVSTTCTVAGKLYSIFQIQPEGTGLATISLAIEPDSVTPKVTTYLD